MGGQKRKTPDTRKAAHSGDAARPSKGTKGQRDAATVSNELWTSIMLSKRAQPT